MKKHPQSMNIIYNAGYTLSRAVATFLFSYRAEGAGNIPEDGPVIIASNHASFLDPPLVGIASRRALWYLARRTLLDWPLLGPILPSLNVIPVDRDGNDRTALKQIIKLLEAGEGVVLFPEGTRSPDGRLQRPQPGLGLLAAKTLAPVVPARIFGSFEAFPKNAKLPTPVPIAVCFGPPLRFTQAETTPASRETYQALSDRVMEAIANIQPPRGWNKPA